MKVSRTSADRLDYVQIWNCVSLSFALSKLSREKLTLLFPDGRLSVSARMPFTGILECPIC